MLIDELTPSCLEAQPVAAWNLPSMAFSHPRSWSRSELALQVSPFFCKATLVLFHADQVWQAQNMFINNILCPISYFYVFQSIMSINIKK